MKLDFSPTKPREAAADALAIGVFKGDESGAAVRDLDSRLEGHLCLHVADEEFKGEEGSALQIHTHSKLPAKHVILIGLGEKRGWNPERVRRAAGRAVKTAEAGKAATLAVKLPLENAGDRALSERAAIEGLLMAGYGFDRYKKEARTKKKLVGVSLLAGSPGDARRLKNAEPAARVAADSAAYARDLVNTPALDMSPAHVAEEARKLAAAEPKRIALEVFGRKELAKMNCGGILAVGRGSAHEPLLAHLTYRPPRKARKRVVLVGKGVTFDSGGLSLKPSEGMTDMKIDMAGAAAVLAVMKALPRLTCDLEVHGVMALVENMPSGTAIRPGDIVTTMSGKTIEILNTDAEGRVTLADALFFGSGLKPDWMVDLATLTGACMVALGQDVAGLLTDDDRLAERLMKASEETGEALWRLPLVSEYAESVKSRHADVKNISGSRYGGTITAGLFLKEFVGDTKWAHIDMAGPAYNEKDYQDYRVWGASGYGARLLMRFLEKL